MYAGGGSLDVSMSSSVAVDVSFCDAPGGGPCGGAYDVVAALGGPADGALEEDEVIGFDEPAEGIYEGPVSCDGRLCEVFGGGTGGGSYTKRILR